MTHALIHKGPVSDQIPRRAFFQPDGAYPYHADVQIGWELAHRASDAATAQVGAA